MGKRPNPEKDKAVRAAKLLRTQVCGVYKITIPTGEVYVGASRHIKERTRKHLYRGIVETVVVLPKDCHRDILDENEIRVYNELKDAGFKMLNEREPGWHGKNSPGMIEKTKRTKKLNPKPSHNKGKKMSQEHCEMMREAFKNRKKGHKQSEETQQKKRETRQRNMELKKQANK